jgi:hypothetical protein
MTGSFGAKLKLGKLKLGNPDFCFQLSKSLLFRQTAAESRPWPLIIRYSIYLVLFTIPSLQACLFPPVLAIFGLF